jgi:hypothetical protein
MRMQPQLCERVSGLVVALDLGQKEASDLET